MARMSLAQHELLDEICFKNKIIGCCYIQHLNQRSLYACEKNGWVTIDGDKVSVTQFGKNEAEKQICTLTHA